MDLHIFSQWDAATFEPVKPTYAIRIFPSWESGAPPLRQSPNYVQISSYTFDDLVFDVPGVEGIWIDEGLASRVVEEFASVRERCEALMVHCTKGENRSPAVTIALNQAFNLGQDTEALKKQFSRANWQVYELILNAAQQRGYSQ